MVSTMLGCVVAVITHCGWTVCFVNIRDYESGEDGESDYTEGQQFADGAETALCHRSYMQSANVTKRSATSTTLEKL